MINRKISNNCVRLKLKIMFLLISRALAGNAVHLLSGLDLSPHSLVCGEKSNPLSKRFAGASLALDTSWKLGSCFVAAQVLSWRAGWLEVGLRGAGQALSPAVWLCLEAGCETKNSGIDAPSTAAVASCWLLKRMNRAVGLSCWV